MNRFVYARACLDITIVTTITLSIFKFSMIGLIESSAHQERTLGRTGIYCCIPSVLVLSTLIVAINLWHRFSAATQIASAGAVAISIVISCFAWSAVLNSPFGSL